MLIPLRDDSERRRRPAVALLGALLCVAAAVWAALGGGGVAAVLACLVNGTAVWVLGAGLESAVSRTWLVLSLLLGAAGGVALGLASSRSGAPLAAWGTTGAALEAVVLHALRLPRAHVLSLVAAPWLTGLVELPGRAWAAIWAGLTLLLGLLGAFGG